MQDENAPIFFYTGKLIMELSWLKWNLNITTYSTHILGNEGDIELFAENTGFMWEIAPKFNALLIFAEHR